MFVASPAVDEVVDFPLLSTKHAASTHLTDGWIGRSKNRDWIKLLYDTLLEQAIALPISDPREQENFKKLKKQSLSLTTTQSSHFCLKLLHSVYTLYCKTLKLATTCLVDKNWICAACVPLYAKQFNLKSSVKLIPWPISDMQPFTYIHLLTGDHKLN